MMLTPATVPSRIFIWSIPANKSSAKDRRKAKQELEKARKEYEAKIKAMEDAEEKDSGNAVTNMVLPEYGSGRNEKDIQVRNSNMCTNISASCVLFHINGMMLTPAAVPSRIFRSETWGWH